MSEEDVKIKVVSDWLAKHGFGPRDISVETSFDIRLGRGVFRVGSKKSEAQVVKPRADVLVRSVDGRNLLIVEVKAPNEPLDKEAKEQSISYARLLREGGIAPFVVLTNGHETHIYDSISGESIEGQAIPLDHPYVKNRFCVSGDDLALRSEALAAIISLSPGNWIEFCRHQVSYHMRPLRSEDLFSGKKYIPALYVEREEASRKLDKLVDEEKRRMVLVVGPPQVGKTSFLSHFVESRLENGLPCLFYPAIGVQKSLFYELSEDFEWIMGQDNSAAQVARRLSRLSKQSKRRLVIVIDGWNEADQALVRTIDHECERVACDEITFVISLTDLSASRVLLDDAGNPSAVAEAAFVASTSTIKALELGSKDKTQNESVVFVEQFSQEERDAAYKRYTELYSVQEPAMHTRVTDPFLLRIGMEYSAGRILPETFDELSLIEHVIQAKIARGVGLTYDSALAMLSKLGTEMFLTGVPLDLSAVLGYWKTEGRELFPKGFVEAAILAKVHTEHGMPAIDFYYSRERNFVIAYWARSWFHQLRAASCKSMLPEVRLAANTSAGMESLEWFLKQRENRDVLESLVTLWENHGSCLKRLLLSCIYEHVCKGCCSGSESWVLETLDLGVEDPDGLVKVEAARLAVLLREDSYQVAGVIVADKQFIVRLLEVDDPYPLENAGVGHVLLYAFRDLHWQDIGQDDVESSISNILCDIAQDNTVLPSIRSSAVKVLGFIAPDLYLEFLCCHIAQGMDSDARLCFKEGIELAVETLSARYYGDMCPGCLDALEDDPKSLKQEYLRMRRICEPVIRFYRSEEGIGKLEDILASLHSGPSRHNPPMLRRKPRNSDRGQGVQLELFGED